jgi:PAS domain S-box-containing protein
MTKKPTYEELEQRVRELEEESLERRQAEEALRESEELFSKAFHSNPNPLLISKLTDGRCIDVNEGFLRALGYNREEVIGRTSSELMLWVDTNDHLKMMQALEQGKRAMLPEVKVRAKSGEIRIMMFAADKIEFGGEECLITTANDITERVKAEEDLHKYERIVAASNDHMSLIDRNYVYQVVNDAYLRSHDIKREDIIGHSVPELFGQEFFETHQKPMIDRCLAGEVARYQSWIDFPTVGRRYMDIAHYPYFEDDGSISGYVVNAHDITERKQAEEALRESDEKYRILFNSINDSVFVHQPRADGKPSKFIEVNDVACRMYGYTREELFELAPLDLAIPERKKDAQMRMRSLFSDKYSIFEISHKTKNGNEIPVEISAHLFDFYGQPTVLSVVRDITDRKQAEEALRESEVKYRLLAENVTDVIWVRDMNLNLTYISPSVKDQQGYTVEEAMNKTLEEVLTPGSFKFIGEVYTEELEIESGSQKGAQRSRTIEVEINCKDSSTIWAEIKMSFLRDNNGKPIGVIGVTRNITERKQAEDALRESEEKFRNLFDLSPQAVALSEATTGKLIDVNNMFCQLTKYSKKEVVGKTTTEVGFYSKDDRAGFIKELQTSEEVNGLEMDFKAKDGSTLSAVVFARAIRISGKTYILTILLNVTEQKRLESQLQQAQKMESIGTLAGGIAHDFNNILGIILGNTELSLYDVPEWNPARLNLEEIRTASLRAKDVVRQLLSFARKTKLEKKPTNIILIIKESLKLLRSSIPTSIEIRQNIPEDIDTILADPTQINQVLINLCTNADHAMPDGGVIVVTLKKIELDEDAAVQHPELNPGRYVNLTISDTGHGISHNEIDRIFDPYFTTKEVGKGTGMGLAVVHGIVKGHNGIILVESELGKGTTFSIFFPVVAKEAVVETETDEKLPTGDERILFVDDEELIVGIGHQMLERLGYKVESTKSPVDALELFRSRPDQFDLVITDMTMPKMTGDKLVKEILKIQPDIPIILCTGFSEKIDEKKARAIGVADYIEKPLDMRDYAMKVRKVLDME